MSDERVVCFHCGAPCKEHVLMRGGDHGWGDDKSRTVRTYDESALQDAEQRLAELVARVVAMHTGENEDGCGMTNEEIRTLAATNRKDTK